jgi:hypothetical protein
MILKTKKNFFMKYLQLISCLKVVVVSMIILTAFNFSTCKYSFKDTAPIPPEVKTFRVNYLENKARYVNPQLSPQLTEKVKQKIIGNTRLHQTNDDNAHYDISGYISDYSITTSGITGNAAGTNRLAVTFHLIFKNTLDPKKDSESDVSYSLDFNSNISQNEVEASRGSDIVSNLADAIFNKIFSNW